MKNLIFILVFFNTLALAQSRFKSFDGTNIAFEVQGKGEAVVLIHGFITNSQVWKNGKLPTELLQNGYKVVFVDLRGNGNSDKPHELSAYQNDAEVYDIIELMKHLKIKKYHVVGYSRGAIIAAKLLIKDNKNIKSATLGGMGTDFTNPDWSRRKMFADAFMGKAHLYPETAGAVNYAKKINADTLALALMQKAQPVTTIEELKSIKTKVLVISGDKDFDNGKAADLAALFKNGTLKSIEGIHNTAHQSMEFAQNIVSFLQLK